MKKILKPAIFVLAGGAAGALYYHFFGCSTGCPITSNLWLTVGYMGLVGLLLSGLFGKARSSNTK